MNANLSHTVAVNQGVNSIVALAELTGPGGAGAADLHDSSSDSAASAQKTVTVDILPDVHVEKTADNSPIVAGDTASFTITSSNDGPGAATNLVMTDDLPGTGWVENPDNPNCVIAADVLTCTYASMNAGDSDSVTVERPTTTEDCGTIPNIANVSADNEDPQHTGDNSANASIIVECPVGEEGCTPGYWKQQQHFDSWEGFVPGDLFSDAFDRVITVRANGKKTVDDPTLLEALKANGGEINALARHGTAALLNASSSGVGYQYTQAQVIQMVQDAIDGSEEDMEDIKNMLALANEAGCPLN
jgi:uncharacterized repeat protein (TIGR01451 family)